MEVREPSGRYLPARRQTELGEVPGDWQVLPFEHFKPFVTSGSRGWAKYYADTGSVFLRITNLSRSRIYPSLDDLRYVAVPADDSEGIRTALAAGDLLISITADIGIVGYVTTDVELPAYINQHIALVRFDPSIVDSRYLAYYMAGSASQLRFRAMTDSGAKAGMNLEAIRRLLAAVPPTKTEQAGIAQALSDADTLIDSLEQLLSKQRQIKQGAMQELLTGQRRLPGFGSEVGHVELGAVCRMQSGGTPPIAKAAFFGGPNAWVSISDITQADKYLNSTERSLTDAGLASCAAQLFPAGSVLYAMYASVGECCIASIPACTSQAILAMQPSPALDSEYLFYWLSHIKAYAKSAVQQGTQGNLNKGMVAALKIRLPSIAEQHAIAQVLTDMDSALTALQARLAKARELKQALMQVLLTGRIRMLPPGATAAGPG
jgi:type I restriction enzyme S subunit